ncbi:hypothetical protein AB0C87_02695 [Actinomadura sp. NPDC048021]|uniref:hypothetical protein n=1 Tax=Actinomadura sp. NPDC048021 TaxID=3155385 RepID=UPI0033E250EC
MPVAQPGTGSDGRLLAAPLRPDPGEPTGSTDVCSNYKEQRDFLPLHRWTSFELFVVDNARIFKTQRFVSMIAGLMFMAAGLCWRIIGTLMGFGYSFDMICQTDAAKAINSVVRTFSLYAAWFLIPAWLFVLAAVVKRWSATGGNRKGPAAAMRLVAVFLAANGLVFFMGDQADKHQDNPTAPYTAPWMATTVQGWFGVASSSLNSLQKIGRFNEGKDTNPVFYDNQGGGTGKVTCAALDATLYDQYEKGNGAASSLGDNGTTTLMQVSKMWEISLVRSWQTAQFGEGTKDYPSPAHASCRFLEAKADVSSASKMKAYDLSVGLKENTTKPEMARGYFISPGADEQMIFVAWGACKGPDSGDGGGAKEQPLIDQWNAPDIDDAKKACGKLFSNKGYENDKSGTQLSVAGIDVLCFMCDNGTMGPFYFNGDDELKDKLGKCYASQPACQADWNFVSAWLGKNQAQRLTQGLLSMIVAFVFLFVMGPMAIGMTVSSVGLAGLVMILPITFLLIGAGLPQGMRVLKLTGAAAAGDFLFTLGLTFLTMFTDTTYQAIEATTNDATPNFFQQVAQGAAPLVALFLFKKISKILSLGDISTTSGATGFATAIVMRSSGDPRLSRNAGQQVSQRLARLGVGRARLGALDERSLQRRMLDNRATRAVAGAAKRRAQRAARPVTDWAKDKYDGGRARLQRSVMNLQHKAASGSPKQRAAAYAGLTAGLAGLTMMAPPAVLATLPLMAFTGAAASVRGGQALGDAIGPKMLGKGAAGASGPPLAAGMPTAASARTAMREADDWHRNIIRVSDPEERQRLIAERTEDVLNARRARLWGAGQPNGLHPDFTGFDNEAEMERGRKQMADEMGLKPDDILMGMSGQALPAPPKFDRVTGRMVYPEGLTPEQFGHWIYHMDPYTLEKKPGETNDQQIARLVAQAAERGYVTSDGQDVDVLLANGFDTRLPEVRERVAHVVSGGKDPEIQGIRITSRRAEDVAVSASREWAKIDAVIPPMPTSPPTVHLQGPSQNVMDVGDAARQDVVGGFSNVRVNSGTAGEAWQQMQRQAGELRNLLQELNDINAAQASGFGADFQVDLGSFRRQIQDGVRNLENVGTQVRDAIDAFSGAQGVCELQVRAAGSGGGAIDMSEIARLADRFTAKMRRDQQQLHEEVERLFGALSRPLDDADGAGSMMDAVDRLTDLLSRRISREERSGQSVADRIRDMEEAFRNSASMSQSDPRMSSSQSQPADIRHIMREMFSRQMSGR